jgi:hypothetical protein
VRRVVVHSGWPLLGDMAQACRPTSTDFALCVRVNTRIGDERYHRCMSDLPPGAFPPTPGQPWGPPPPASSTPSAQTPFAPPMAFRRPARWPTFTALAIALIALAVGLVGWFRPAPHNDQMSASPKPTYTDKQVANAKANLCTAFEKVEHALHLADARSVSDDPTALLAVAEGAWQAFDAGSRYLSTKLAEEPAAPPELGTAVQKQANAFQEVLINYLDGLHNSDPDMQPAVRDSDEATLAIRRLCK